MEKQIAAEEQMETVVEDNTAQDTETLEEITVTTAITFDQVHERLDEIKKLIEEQHPVVASEKAHVEQDKMLRDVLEAIAAGASNPVEMANAALEVFQIDFTRWYR
jgi:predicted DNA-binding ArsR family transcriptional regulator